MPVKKSSSGIKRLLKFRLSELFNSESFMFGFFEKFSDPWKAFLKSVRVSSFLPGRIRCYSRLVVNNPENAALLESAFSGFPEITCFAVNQRTGSVLISYDPEQVAQNPYLKKIEEELKSGYLKESR